MKKILLFSFFVGFSLILSQCNSEEDPAEEQRKKDKETIEKYVAQNSLSGSYLDLDLYKVLVKEGSGSEAPKSNEGVLVTYSLATTGGTVVSASTIFYQHSQSFFFYGWEYAVNTMKEGEIAKFVIPSALVYGNQSAGITVPANSVLVLDVELKNIYKNNIPEAYAAFKGLTGLKTSTGLFYSSTTPGVGSTPTSGQAVTVKYKGYFLTGDTFDSGTYTYTVGTQDVIKGWQEGIPLLKKGEKAVLVIPSELGYGVNGTKGIPGNAVLAFDVEILDIK